MMKNQYYQDWYETSQLIFDNPMKSIGHQQSSTDMSGHIGGAATLAATYVAAGLLLKSGNPYAMAAGGLILAIPDPIIYGIGYVIFD